MIRLLFLSCSLFVLFFSACQKSPSLDVSNSCDGYCTYTVGSYWIYQHVMIDSNHVENILPSTDTFRVIKDSIINGQTYVVLERTVNSNSIMFPAPHFSHTSIVRDSLHYLVTSSSAILFSSQDFNSTLLDLSRTRTENGNTFTEFFSFKMENVVDSVSVPVGTFKVLNYERTSSSTDPIMNPIYAYKNRNQYYAKGVGKILESYVFAEKRVLEQRLLEYHIQ